MEIRPGEVIELPAGMVLELSTIPDKVHVGDVVKITAVDWAIHLDQVERNHPFGVMRGNLYGEVVRVTEEFVTLAPQTFTDGGLRCVLTVPIVTIERVEILEKADG